MQGKRAKPAVKIPLNSLLFTWNTPPIPWTPPSLSLSHTHTHTLTDYIYLFAFPPFPNKPASCQAKDSLFPPSLFISRCLCHLLLLSLHPKIPDSSLLPPPILPAPFPSVWTRLAPGSKQRRVCVLGGRDGVSVSEGTMLLLVALNLKLLLSRSVCLFLINYLKFTFTEAQNTIAWYSTISLIYQPTGQCCRTPLDSNFSSSKTERKSHC